MAKEEVKIKSPAIEMDGMKIHYERKKHIPMCGYHNNYSDFTKGRIKGTIVFVGNAVGISIGHEFSFTLPLDQIVAFCLKERARELRAKK